MKKRIASLVTLIVFLVTFVFSNVDNTKAESEEVVVHTPKNMLDVSVVDNSGNPIKGIQMTLVDASGVEVATWTTGRSEVNSAAGSYICGYDNENSRYRLYNWKILEDAQKLIGEKATIKLIRILHPIASQIIYEEGDSLSESYYCNQGDNKDNEICSVEYIGDDETAMTLEGGKVATVIDPSYKKGDVSIDFTSWQLKDYPGTHIHDMTPGEYSCCGKTMTVSNERTEYVKVRTKLSYNSSYFNDDGTYEHYAMGTVSFPSNNPDETSVLAFCSGSVITVPRPDSDGYVEVYIEKNSREAILNTEFRDSSDIGQGGISIKRVIYEEKRYIDKIKELSPTGTLLLYVPAGSYTVKMSSVPQAYESKDPISVTVADSDEIQPLSITLADAHTHTYGTEYKNDATNHWNECACGAKGNVAAHTPGPEATETSPQVCTVCGYEIAPKKTHVHTYGTEYKSDATNHWNECACGAKGNVAAHTPGTEATETSPQVCTVCGYEIAPKKPHVYGTEYKSDATNHWNECACGAKGNVAAHTPGPEATETSPQVCTVCGYEITPKKPHVYGTEYKSDETNHWNECACGAKGNVAAHTPGPEATETSPQVCTVCGYEIAPKKPHVYGTEYKSDETNHWNECACGAKGNVAAHTPGPEATETSSQVCMVCGYEIAPKKPHVYGTEYKSDATNHWNECACGAKGNVAAHTPGPEATETSPQVCTVCGYEIAPKKTHVHTYGAEYKNDATNHWNECACGTKGNVAAHTPGPEATETSPQVCTVCGYEIAPKKTHVHTYGTEYKSDATNHWNECACGAKGNVAAHTPGPEATETSPQVCTVCGYEIAPKKTHVHTYGTEYKSDATNHWNECECGAKTGIEEHTYTWVIDKEATQTQEGSKHEVCSVCGYKKLSVTIPVVEITQTGDNNNVILLFVFVGAAFVLMTGVAVYGKRRSFR